MNAETKNLAWAFFWAWIVVISIAIIGGAMFFTFHFTYEWLWGLVK